MYYSTVTKDLNISLFIEFLKSLTLDKSKQYCIVEIKTYIFAISQM